VEIKGKEGTPYEGGVFGFEIKLIKKKVIPPFIKLTEDDLNCEKTVAELKGDLYKKYDIIPLGLQLHFKGRAMHDRSKLTSFNFNPKTDRLMVGGMMAGPSPWIEGYAYCYTIIWHPNIDSNTPPGKQNFYPKSSANANLCNFIGILKKFIHLEPEVLRDECPINRKAAEQFKNDLAKFNMKAKRWTSKYAQKVFYREMK